MPFVAGRDQLAKPLQGRDCGKSPLKILPLPAGMSMLEKSPARLTGIIRRGGRVADRGGLLSRCRGHTLPRVRIPPSPLPTQWEKTSESDPKIGNFLVFSPPEWPSVGISKQCVAK